MPDEETMLESIRAAWQKRRERYKSFRFECSRTQTTAKSSDPDPFGRKSDLKVDMP